MATARVAVGTRWLSTAGNGGRREWKARFASAPASTTSSTTSSARGHGRRRTATSTGTCAGRTRARYAKPHRHCSSRLTSYTVHLAPCTVHLTAYHLTSQREDPWPAHAPPATCHTAHAPPATCLPPPRVRSGWIRENFDNIRLNEHQRINHFRNHYELTRKDSMIKNLKRAQRALLREGLEEEAAKYDFSPTTYVLPTYPSPSPSPSPRPNSNPHPNPIPYPDP